MAAIESALPGERPADAADVGVLPGMLRRDPLGDARR